MSKPSAPRTWTLTFGYAKYKGADGKYTKEPVIVAVGPLPKPNERITVEEVKNG